ncbi:PDZ domain-containing protein [Glaciecola sp. XM2]|nr:PDZ domain-containing protein [Glaciecola sp. XM2]
MTFASFAQATQAYLRDPALHKNTLIFTSEGDLWRANVNGSETTLATRITTQVGLETAATISPDGSNVAFVANYGSGPGIHVMPINGGKSRQVSFELSNIKLHGWQNNKEVLYSTLSELGMHNSWVLKTLNIDSLKTRTIPVSDAVEGVISNNDNTLFFTQFGLQVSTDNANHYKGGARGELWRFDLDSNDEAVHLTAAHEGSVRSPMLYGGRLFFLSNAGGIDNIWSMELDGSDIRPHTSFDDFAVRAIYLHGNQMVFQHGADIKAFNLLNNQTSRFDITLQSDFAHLKTKYVNEPLQYLESASLANDGEKVVITARGRMAVADNDVSRLVNIASDKSARNRHAVLSQDNKHVYSVSDRTGEYEIWQFNADGSSTAKQLTDDGKVLRTGLWLSPNGESLVHADKDGNLFLLDIESAKNTLLLDNLGATPDDIAFSKDSRWLSFGYLDADNERPRIYLRDLESSNSQLLTTDKYASYAPAFSRDGQWLYFLSDRSFNPNPGSPWGDRNMGQAFEDRTLIFAIALNEQAVFPFAPPTELTAGKEKSEDKDKDEDEDEENTDAPSIEWQGIDKRLWQLPVPAGDYSDLVATESHLFWLKDSDGNGDELQGLAFGHDKKPETVTSGVSAFQLSGNTEHLLVQKGRGTSAKMYIVPAKPDFPKKADDALVKLNAWNLVIEPRMEWQQIFKDAWLMHRDSLFDPNMRGIDWAETKAKYAPLLARVTERSELNDIFEQMMGELNALHSQVRGGDIARAENAPSYASLGGVFVDTDRGVQIRKIYEFDAEILEAAPPLAQPGVDAQNGDLITHVNGQEIDTVAELMQQLVNQAGQQTLLTLVRDGDTHKTIVIPQSSGREAIYRYNDWTNTKLSQVTAQNPDIGYLHLYAMGGRDIASFARDFYAQYDKPGLIIDVRRNRGGNIDSVIIEKLLRRAWSFWHSTNGLNQTNMQQTFRGHLVVLADEFTYSDGETFTAGVKALDLGTVIGRKTAGAGVWLSGGNRATDGGIARVAEFPVFAMDGRWITEGEGISPDIEVRNYPHATFNGEDAQLQAALAYLQEKLKAQPIKALEPKPFGPVEQAADDILPNAGVN